MRWKPNARILLSAAVAIGCYALIFCELKPRVFWANPDFAGFYRAGKMVTSGDGARVYELEAQRAYDRKLQQTILQPGQRMVTLPFLFAPFTLLLFAPISRLPYSSAETAWFALNVIAILAVPILLRTAARMRDGTVVAALLVTPFFLPVTLAIMHGQTSILSAFLLTLAIIALAKHYDARAGAILALASFKPQLVLPILLALLAARKFKTLFVFAITLLGLLAASFVQLGWQAVLSFPRAIVEFEHLSPDIFQEHPEFMPNLRGLAIALLPGWSKVALATVVISMSVLLLGIVIAVFARQDRYDFQLRFSLLLTITVLTSYHCYLHDASILVLVGLLMAAYISERGWSAVRAVLALTMALIFLAPLASPFAAIGSRLAVALLMFTALLLLELVKCTDKSRRLQQPSAGEGLIAEPQEDAPMMTLRSRKDFRRLLCTHFPRQIAVIIQRLQSQEPRRRSEVLFNS